MLLIGLKEMQLGTSMNYPKYQDFVIQSQILSQIEGCRLAVMALIIGMPIFLIKTVHITA